jgi:hypothetical protein
MFGFHVGCGTEARTLNAPHSTQCHEIVRSVTEFAMEIRNEREKEKKTVFLCHFCCCERAAYSSAISSLHSEGVRYSIPTVLVKLADRDSSSQLHSRSEQMIHRGL